MKSIFYILTLFLSLPVAHASERAESTLVLDPNTLANLRLEFATAEPMTFEETAFALGRIEARPGATAAVSSRIAGRVIGLNLVEGDQVSADETLIRIESRQPGNPPPSISLTGQISGIVTKLNIHLGDPVEPDNSLMEITDLTSVHAVARVPEHAVGRLQTGHTLARIRLTAFPDKFFTGHLVRLGTLADSANGTLEAHFLLDNADGKLRPGMRAEFSLILSRRDDVIAVPREAVQGEGVGPRYVFTRDFELPNGFLRTQVVLGAQNDRFAEIERGLFPGDEVVTRGSYSLAFAGSGGLSLKEALDAAHGHEHADDGSELQADDGQHEDHNHDETEADDHAHEAHSMLWKIATGFFALLSLGLGLSLLLRIRITTTNVSRES